MRIILLFTTFFLITSFGSAQEPQNWELGPFERIDRVNPIILPLPHTLFNCPLQKRMVHWECDHTFNPAAVVRKGKVYLIYRAEDDFGNGIGQHTSRLGLAHSKNGLHFERMSNPVIFPAQDDQYEHEWPGGCEDPRIVESEDGRYIMMYTQWNRKIPVLAVATSKDLFDWKKHGYVFDKAYDRTYGRHACKSGSIVCREKNDHLIATKIQEKYWMYWGEGCIHLAHSDDLLSWTPLLDENGELISVLHPRPGKFDSGLVEPGPPAIITKKGIVLLFNGKNDEENGDPTLNAGAYAAGQALFDINDPKRLISRTEECFLKPELSFETNGQYREGTVFIEGLVHFRNRWFLYYGTADSAIGVAVTKNLSLQLKSSQK